MAIAGKLTAIGMIALSMVVGFISFYIISDIPKEQKKKQLEELVSQLINFVLFVWLGKIILNLKVFLIDPLAILAYPSDANAFYLAVLISIIVLVYNSKRKQMDVQGFIESFMPVFLIASFLYEFIQLVWSNNVFSFGYLALLSILLVLYFVLLGRIPNIKLILVVFSGWVLGMLGVLFYQPYVTVFGYMMQPWFLIVFFIMVLLFMMKYRKRVT